VNDHGFVSDTTLTSNEFLLIFETYICANTEFGVESVGIIIGAISSIKSFILANVTFTVDVKAGTYTLPRVELEFCDIRPELIVGGLAHE